MDGSLDDPLVRMHRWEALRQKLADRRGTRLEPVLDEVAEALGDVLRRNSSVAVTVVVEDAQAQAAMRLMWFGGRLTVTRIDPAGEPDAADQEPTAPRAAAVDAPVAGRPPPTNGAGPAWPPNIAAAGLARPPDVAAAGPARPPDVAARLADLIRRDPSLLEEHDPRGGG